MPYLVTKLLYLQRNSKPEGAPASNRRAVSNESDPFRVGGPDESFYDEEEDLEDEMLKHPFSDFVVDPTGDLYYAWQVRRLFSS